LQISMSSTEPVRVGVNTIVNGVAGFDPRTFTVQFAITHPVASPAVWVDGTWETGNPNQRPPYFCSVLVGPSGAITPAPGEWTVWVQIAAGGGGTPVQAPGVLTITNP
jgi:hypothetical protein